MLAVCSQNPAILSTCPVSCGVCTSMCLDKLNDCPQWAAAGDCLKNPGFMMKECPRSCDLCGEGKSSGPVAKCENRNQQQCLLWGEQECPANPASMLSECPSLCGACTVACVDTHSDCPQWTAPKAGGVFSKGSTPCEADSHLPAMCPASCGICAQLHVREPPGKQEL